MVLHSSLPLNVITNNGQQREHRAFVPPEALFPAPITFHWMLFYTE